MTDALAHAALTRMPPDLEAACALTSNGLVRSKSVVLRVLNTMMTQGSPLSIRFLNTQCTLESSLIFVGEASNTLLLACPPEWQMILKAPPDTVMVGCAFDDSKIEFQAGACAKVDLDGMPVVGMPIPEFFWRFQRRRDQRQRPHSLKIVLNMGVLEAEAQIVNLSVGGVGLLHGERDLKLVPGESLRNCEITLPGVGRIPVNLVVQHSREAVDANGRPIASFGCKFVGLAEQTRQLIAHYLTGLAGA